MNKKSKGNIFFDLVVNQIGMTWLQFILDLPVLLLRVNLDNIVTGN